MRCACNLEIEFKRNRERYQFLKWGLQAFKTFSVVPPGIGIVHQVNLEYLAKGVLSAETSNGTVYYPDTLVGTDSHTTMINGLGVVGWGVGGIEAEAGMLGQPVYFLTPEVVGVHLTGDLKEGVTATDLVLRVTEMLRKQKVVGKFVEFFGEGAAALHRHRSGYHRQHGSRIRRHHGLLWRRRENSSPTCVAPAAAMSSARRYENYYKAQGLWGIPRKGDVDYYGRTRTGSRHHRAWRSRPETAPGPDQSPRVEAGPLRPSLTKPLTEGGYGKKTGERVDQSAGAHQWLRSSHRDSDAFHRHQRQPP